MKIALYYPWIYLKSGVERTILETVRRSKHEYTIFTNHYDKKGTYAEFKSLNVIELNRIPVRRDILSVIKASFVIILQKIDLRKFDLFLVHSEGIGDFILFRNKSIPTVSYCHTPLRPVFDSEYKIRARNKRSVIRKFVYSLLDLAFKITDRFLWRRYKYIFFNSKETVRRAKRGNLLSPGGKFSVLHPGIDWKSIKPAWKYEKYFFLPGRIMWTKNIELAISAFKIFEQGEHQKRFRLVIAGQVDRKSEPYFKKIKSLARNNNNISFIKNPSVQKMKSLYANCYCVVASSFNEDWGLTPVEGNAFGKAAICVNRGGFKESQVNGKTGFLVNDKPTDLATKMSLLAGNASLARKIGKDGRRYSQKFSWDNFIYTFDKVIEGYKSRL